MQIGANENIKVTGEITAKFYDQSKLSAVNKKINYFLEKLRDKMDKNIFQKLYRLGPLVLVDEHKNVICNNGFNTWARRLAGDTTYTGVINKMLLGTGVVTPNATNTQLTTEAYRNNTASATSLNNISYLTAYFTEGECSGTYKEFGNVIDGTASVNTGQLWSHLGGLNWVKTNLIVLVVSCKYTFASA